MKSKSKSISISIVAMFLLSFLFFSFVNTNSVFAKVYSFGITSDGGQYTSNLTFLKKSFLELNTKDLILVGDSAPRDNESTRATLEEIWGQFMNDFNFTAAVVGNHNKGYQREMDFFKMPGDYYSVRPINDLLVIGLNSDERNNQRVTEEINFLQNQLANASEKMIIIIFHNPPANVAPNHNWTEKKEFVTKVVALLKRYKGKISAVIAGHVHIATFVDIDGIPLFISPSPVQPRDARYFDSYDNQLKMQVTNKWVYKNQRNRYWLKLDVNTDDNSMKFDYINIDNRNNADCTILISSDANSRIAGKSYSLQNNCSKSSL
ncbi:MAG: metallophosphoesterase [Oligoflexia bacterium]|nr:metallophosphoesterase [Oligoflexia bacterium]